MGGASSQRVLVYEFLSGGGEATASEALLPQGIEMRDAIATDLLHNADCELSVATCAVASPPPAGAMAVCAVRGEDALAFVERQARVHDAVWVVAPETDGCLAGFERRLSGLTTWLGCDAAAIALATSKAATLERLRARGVMTPLADAFASPAAQRWVVKPDDGAGAVDTRVHADRDRALADLRQRRGCACIEPWIDGPALSLSLLCGRAGVELLSVNRQRIAVADDGAVRYEGVDIDVMRSSDPQRRALEALARRVAAALPGLRGFVGVDVVWHATQGAVVIEVNPRLTCAYVGLSQRLSRNLAQQVLQEFGLG